MSDILDQIQQQELAAENAGLAAAQHNLNWAQTFNSIPPAEKLRATRNLEDQVATALERRRSLAAQVDEKAQRIYYNAKKFEHELEQEPLRKELLEAQIERERASTNAVGLAQRTKEADDIADLQDLSAMNEAIGSIEYDLGSAEYLRELNKVAVSHPRALTTVAGREIYMAKSKRHQDISSIPKPPSGHRIKSITWDGDSPRVVYEPDEVVTEKPMTPYQRESLELRRQQATRPSQKAMADLQKLESEQAGRRKYLEQEPDPVKKALLQKDIDAGNAAIEAWKATYGAPIATTAAAPIRMRLDENGNLVPVK